MRLARASAAAKKAWETRRRNMGESRLVGSHGDRWIQQPLQGRWTRLTEYSHIRRVENQTPEPNSASSRESQITQSQNKPLIHRASDSKLIPGLRLRKHTDDAHVWPTLDSLFEVLATYRHLPRRAPNAKNVSHKTVGHWFRVAGMNSKTPLEVSAELRPTWGPFLAIDGKMIKIREKTQDQKLKSKVHCLLIACDAHTQDIPATKLLRDEHSTLRLFVFIRKLQRELGLDPEMYLIDDNPSLMKAIKTHLGPTEAAKRTQIDVYHKMRTINKIFPKKKINKIQRELKRSIFQFLRADTLEESERIYDSIMSEKQKWSSEKSKKAIQSIESDHDLLLTHFRVDQRLGLAGENRSPRTTSQIEGLNSRIEPKLDKVRGFKSLESAESYCKLLVMKYRASPFESNGDKRSPLERAGVKKIDDWIWFSQKRRSTKEAKN